MSVPLSTDGPNIVTPYSPDHSGVDFLGMRAVNLNMMAGVLPGINNVTTSVRPFSVLSWLYWKFHQLAAEARISQPTDDQLRTWKEKVEVLFTWGHKLKNRQGLPGISFNPPGPGEVPLTFVDWKRNGQNTSLMAAVQYGPAAKAPSGLGFLDPVSGSFFRACGEGLHLAEALDASIGSVDTCGLLRSLNSAHATSAQASELLPGWEVDNPHKKEKEAFRRAFFDASAVGQDSLMGRRSTTVRLILDLVAAAGTPMTAPMIRSGLFFGRPNPTVGRNDGEQTRDGWWRWQVLQMRQLQRLALEALLSWFEGRLVFERARDMEEITAAAAKAIEAEPTVFPPCSNVAAYSGEYASKCANISEFLALAEVQPLWSPFELSKMILAHVPKQGDAIVPHALRALFVCARFTELMAPFKAARAELLQGMAERMSLWFLTETIGRCAQLELSSFLSFLFENLILSQHFSVAAYRFDGERQRLRFSIEEEGLTFLADRPLVPIVTPDRLASALSLMTDCDLLCWDRAAMGFYLPKPT